MQFFINKKDMIKIISRSWGELGAEKRVKDFQRPQKKNMV